MSILQNSLNYLKYHQQTLAYVFFTGIFLLSSKPIHFYLTGHKFTWYLLVKIFVFVTIAYFYTIKKDRIGNRMLYGNMLLLYISILLISGFFHHFSLGSFIPSVDVNVVGENTADWKKLNQTFADLYLHFPVLLLLQVLLLKRIPLESIAKINAVIILFSIVTIFFQSFAGSTLFVTKQWVGSNRFGGLSADPNAYALTAFLLVPLLVAGSISEKNVYWKTFLLIVSILLAGSILLTGNRTSVGGIVLLILSFPVILAIANKQWTNSRRVLFATSPIWIVFAILPFVSSILSKMASFSLVAQRMLWTYNKFQDSGITGIFFSNELRGKIAQTGVELISKSPLAGWGAGGFYREYPNVKYLSSGKISHTPDSILNHYLMIASDFGLPAMLINILLIFIPIALAIHYLLKFTNSPKQRLILAILIFANIIFLIMIITIPPSYFPGIIWVWAGQLAYLFLVHQQSSKQRKNSPLKKGLSITTGLIVLALSGIGTFNVTYGSQGYYARQHYDWWLSKNRYLKNCYEIEMRGEKDEFRWCGKNASLQVSLSDQKKGVRKFFIKSYHPDIEQNPLVVQYGAMGSEPDEIILNNQDWHSIEISITKKSIYKPDIPRNNKEKYVVFYLRPSRTWSPKQFGGNDDRELGVMIKPVR